MNNLTSGTVTFLFTDIEGSTKLAQEYPDTWGAMRKRHDAIMRSAIELPNGYVFKTIGDSFCAAFHQAGDALQAAIKAQVDLYAENWGDIIIKARMGLHTGKAEVQDDGDYNGYATLRRIQRLMSAGHGGQLLISQATQDLIRDELPQGVTLRYMGEHRLKDLIHPEKIYQLNILDPMLHEVGLEAALEWLAEQTQERHGIRVRFDDDEQPKESDENVRILLFHAVHELLMNVIKHANASPAIVAVRRREEQVEVRIEDDGVGFDAEGVRVRVGQDGGFGLFSIRERLDVIGGTFEISSSPGAGSRATLRAPLQPAAAVATLEGALDFPRM